MDRKQEPAQPPAADIPSAKRRRRNTPSEPKPKPRPRPTGLQSAPRREKPVETVLRQKEQQLEQAQRDLKLCQEELQDVLTSIPDFLWSRDVDSEGRLIKAYTSPAVERITGRPTRVLPGGQGKVAQLNPP